MKLSWGTKIAILYSTFVIFILSMVYMSFGQKFDLVTEDYYAQEMKFQQKIDNKHRAEQLSENLRISLEKENLIIHFPTSGGNINGNIHCFRPSDQNLDFMVKIEASEGLQQIPLQKMSKGKYLLKIEWENNEIEYYSEQLVIIP